VSGVVWARHAVLACLCAGIAFANAVPASLAVPAAACAAAVVAAGGEPRVRLAAAGVALALAGWWLGSLRLAALDRSALATHVGEARHAVVVVTAPARRSRFDVRVLGRGVRFGALRIDEPVLLRLPPGRAPPQGAIVEALTTAKSPRGASNGFDERAWLARQGVHVVLTAASWRRVGTRGGPAGVADRLRAWLGRGAASGLVGERRALVVGVVLGDDQGLSEGLRRRFRASGLYHLLAVSGQNVTLIAGGALASAWLLGIPRLAGELVALLAILGYVAAVGAQPSVVRAGVAGALGSLAWLSARERERWYALLLGALVLLLWRPSFVLDPGFQLSFAAVAAIFELAPRIRRALDGYPLPGPVAEVTAIATACGAATAPIAWLQFHAVPLLTVPANLAAAPAVAPLLGLALAAAVVSPVAPSLASVLSWLAGLCAAYVATCAQVVGGLPFAQVRSGRAVAAVAAVCLLGAAYAWRRGERARAGLSPDGH
jgi:competence protein ComEC